MFTESLHYFRRKGGILRLARAADNEVALAQRSAQPRRKLTNTERVFALKLQLLLSATCEGDIEGTYRTNRDQELPTRLLGPQASLSL